MITNTFHKHNTLIGINIERNIENNFIISIAYKENNQWSAKTLSGFSGDLDNEKIVEQVLDNGSPLHKDDAELMFSNAKNEFGEYI